MMYWGDGDWNWAAWLVMTLTMAVFWGAIVWAVVVLVRRPANQAATPDQILDERFARGEIDEEEYGRRKDALRRS